MIAVPGVGRASEQNLMKTPINQPAVVISVTMPKVIASMPGNSAKNATIITAR